MVTQQKVADKEENSILHHLHRYPMFWIQFSFPLISSQHHDHTSEIDDVYMNMEEGDHLKSKYQLLGKILWGNMLDWTNRLTNYNRG